MSGVILAERNGVYYEGDSRELWLINPAPVISTAKFERHLEPVQDSGVMLADIRFREDLFDPITRIRRGRFYGPDGTGHPRQWFWGLVSSYPRPPLPNVSNQAQMTSAFRPLAIKIDQVPSLRNSTVFIGDRGFESGWRIVDIERTIQGELLFTLKSIFSFGILPALTTSDPEIQGAHEAVLNVAHSLAPVPVADVCRESACVALRKCFNGTGDLANVIKSVPENRVMVVAAANIISRLHPRGKSSEQIRRQVRPVMDEDAALAVRLFGFLLVELGYATV